MITPPKLPGMEKEQNTISSKDSIVRDGDAHAMRALLKSDQKGKGENSDLSSLFSTQTRQAATDLKGPNADRDLEQRLKQYTAAKDLIRKKLDGENSREGHGQGQPQGSEHRDQDPLDQLAQAVAEHILVSDKAHMDFGSDQEVRIKIKETILKDAHVHMVNRHDCLEVKLISSDELSVQTLIEARDSLEKQLEKNHKGLIRISIVHLKSGADA